MTIDQFDLTGFTVSMKVEYDGKEYDLQGVDFEERLIAINNFDDADYLRWVRCENIKLILQ